MSKRSNYLTDTVPLIINGKEIQTSTRFPVISPNTSEVIWESSSASRKEAIDAVEAASCAFSNWSNSRAEERSRIFLKAAAVIEERAEELENYIIQETGALDQFAQFNIKFSADLLRDVAGRISTALTGWIPQCSDEGTQALVMKEPYGVILAVAPWYFDSFYRWR